MRTWLLVAGLGAMVGCSQPHRFEVDISGVEVDRAELTLYNETTAMTHEGNIVSAERANRADGSGQIAIYRVGGEPIICPIGYVSSGESEPHRFVTRNGTCQPV